MTTETNFELIGLAAKAAVFPFTIDGQNGRWYQRVKTQWPDCPTQTKVWNPLENDGDALRLAVKLNMGISIHSGQCDAVAQKGTLQTEKNADTAYATRLAITKAAAEIGKTMLCAEDDKVKSGKCS